MSDSERKFMNKPYTQRGTTPSKLKKTNTQKPGGP